MTNHNGTRKGGSAEPMRPAASSGTVLFELGETCLTRGAFETIPIEDVMQAIRRHAHGDWGNLDSFDRQQNELALRDGSRLFSAYRAGNGVKFWVITEWDRSQTTVLLPEEY